MQRLHTGDLVCIKGFEVRVGVVLCLFTINTYRIFWFKDRATYVLPRALLKKIETDIFCP